MVFRVFILRAPPNPSLSLSLVLLFVVYLQLQDPECLTSSSTPIEQAACFMAHSLGYVVLSLAHTASSVRLSGQVSSHSEQRPRLIRASHRHFFPALHWMSSHDLASDDGKGRKGGRFSKWGWGSGGDIFDKIDYHQPH